MPVAAVHVTDIARPEWVEPAVILVGLLVIGALLRLAWRNRHRVRVSPTGVCRNCAYDRRGLAPTAPCPECGSTPPPL